MKNWQQHWKAGLLPGLSITGFVLLARLLGALQPLEWKALDVSLRWRPSEDTDTRITVVAITEEDIQAGLDHPIPDKDLAVLVQTLQSYEPRVIGIDIFRDKPVGEGFAALETALTEKDNIVGIETIDPPVIPPAPMLEDRQVGFADAIADDDGALRRSQLGNADVNGEYHFSLTIQLAQTYLDDDGYTLENGIRDPETMRFGDAEIPRFRSNAGGYVRTDQGGNQALINFRAGDRPFTQVSYTDVMGGDVDPSLLQDRALLIGYTAESVKDTENSGAIANINPSAVPGITIQAHALSQILSAVYDERPFLTVLPDPVEYLLILGAGLLGIALAHWQRKPAMHLLIVIIVSASWLLLVYLIAIAAWWIPVVPTLAVFLLNAVALYPFYQAQFQLQAQINEQDKLIEQTYTTIHNGPLQVIAGLLRVWPEGDVAPAEKRSQLELINKELRNIREILKEEMRSPSEKLVMMGEQPVDLQMPLHNVLNETFHNTLKRHSSFFKPILQVTTFEPMGDSRLTGREKRSLGRFLEECLINIYKYAKGTTRITVVCKRTDQENIIKVSDNGIGYDPQLISDGSGTQQARRIARQLGGKFHRTAEAHKGVTCELRWPVQRSEWSRWQR